MERRALPVRTGLFGVTALAVGLLVTAGVPPAAAIEVVVYNLSILSAL
jgi:hypothetical protein